MSRVDQTPVPELGLFPRVCTGPRHLTLPSTSWPCAEARPVSRPLRLLGFHTSTCSSDSKGPRAEVLPEHLGSNPCPLTQQGTVTMTPTSCPAKPQWWGRTEGLSQLQGTAGSGRGDNLGVVMTLDEQGHFQTHQEHLRGHKAAIRKSRPRILAQRDFSGPSSRPSIHPATTAAAPAHWEGGQCRSLGWATCHMCPSSAATQQGPSLVAPDSLICLGQHSECWAPDRQQWAAAQLRARQSRAQGGSSRGSKCTNKRAHLTSLMGLVHSEH